MAGIKYCPECISTKMRRKSEKRILASNPGYTLVIWQCPECKHIIEERRERRKRE
ncbi:MAG: hypothetical protein QME47_07605 [Candidatus Thermoplasmatota archaeon]|nr:hypothetical protein [Candidatus Thermoplasmatota archaeon]